MLYRAEKPSLATAMSVWKESDRRPVEDWISGGIFVPQYRPIRGPTEHKKGGKWADLRSVREARSGSQCEVDLRRHRVPQIPSAPWIMSFPHSIPLISLLLIPDLLSLSFAHVIPGSQHDKSWVWSQTDSVRDGKRRNLAYCVNGWDVHNSMNTIFYTLFVQFDKRYEGKK